MRKVNKMTIREFAKKNGIKISGKLRREVVKFESFNYKTLVYETEATVYWEDEVGNHFEKHNGEWFAWDLEGNEYNTATGVTNAERMSG